mmetsp:Transcript_16542/g.32328  ORF Transcript_16542/g.32328 Transcript_16542/m.32328 type:complete len:88 (+) Transcript_16542:34-297(+)
MWMHMEKGVEDRRDCSSKYVSTRRCEQVRLGYLCRRHVCLHMMLVKAVMHGLIRDSLSFQFADKVNFRNPSSENSAPHHHSLLQKGC